MVAFIERKITKIKDNIFLYLLRWYCEKRLDQWERWQLETKRGEVFIDISTCSDGYHYDKLK